MFYKFEIDTFWALLDHRFNTSIDIVCSKYREQLSVTPMFT